MVWIISQFLKKLLDNVCRDLHPWRSLIAHKWYSVNGYFFLLFIFHCVPSDVSLDCTCIWESLPGYISLLGWDVKFVISVSLKPGVPLSPTHFYDLQADTSDHQSWKSLKDTVDIFHSLTSMPEKMCFMFRPRPAAKLLPAGPWASAFNFLCRLSFSAFPPPLPGSLTALSRGDTVQWPGPRQGWESQWGQRLWKRVCSGPKGEKQVLPKTNHSLTSPGWGRKPAGSQWFSSSNRQPHWKGKCQK